MDIFYIEFGGDPSDDKEIYKRYSSRNTKMNPIGNDAEIIELVEKKYLDAANEKIKILESRIDRMSMVIKETFKDTGIV